jgi:hypothetical protein
LWIAQFEDHAVRGHFRSRLQNDALDAAVGRGRNPAHVFRNEHAAAAHDARERSAFDGLDDERRRLDRRRRRLEPRERDAGEHDREDDEGGVDRAPRNLSRGRGSDDVHVAWDRRKGVAVGLDLRKLLRFCALRDFAIAGGVHR